MSNKPKTNIRPLQAPAPMTAEEKQARLVRLLAQRRDSVLQGCLFNLCANPAMADRSPEAIVDQATAIADEYLERYLKEMTDTKEEEAQ